MRLATVVPNDEMKTLISGKAVQCKQNVGETCLIKVHIPKG